MAPDRVAAIEALLAETQAAHSEYERTELNGVYDREWPRWYAEYAVGHGIGGLLDRAVTADELSSFLARTWEEFQRADPKPPDAWGPYTARRLATEL